MRGLFNFVTVVCFALGVFTSSFRYYVREYSDPQHLLDAAASGDVESVKMLLGRGVKPDTRDGWGGTALMYASANGHSEVVEELLNAGGLVDERSRMNRTPLMWAGKKRTPASCQALDRAKRELHT